MTDEYNNVLCDECEEPVGAKAYRVNYGGCYCLACALHIASEDLTNTGSNVDVSIDKVDASDFVNGYI